MECLVRFIDINTKEITVLSPRGVRLSPNSQIRGENKTREQSTGVGTKQQQTTDERVQLVCCPSLGLVRDAAGCTYL